LKEKKIEDKLKSWIIRQNWRKKKDQSNKWIQNQNEDETKKNQDFGSKDEIENKLN
jgi:hypothetical protein